MNDSRLLPNHRELIEASAISREVAAERGYWSATESEELRSLGFGEAQALVPSFVIPVFDVTGRVAFHQVRPDCPRRKGNGKIIKYETPRGARMVVDVPPSLGENLGDPRIPLYITEGVRKADSAVSHGLCCIDLLGVWNWRGSNENGGKVALACWDSITLNKRDVFVVFDSDVMTKEAVNLALVRFQRFLEQQ